MSNAGFDDKHSHPSWTKALQETALALKLDAAAVKAILEAWTSAPAGSGAPDRDRIWYRGNRPWVVAQLEAAGLRASKPGQQRMDGGLRGLSVVKNDQFETKAEYMARTGAA